MKVGVVKYNAGNWQSLLFALERLGVAGKICSTPAQLSGCDKVIFPGVGHAATAMCALKDNGLDRAIVELKVPFLGICLGMQLMCKSSAEGQTSCLGLFPYGVEFMETAPRVPHMGWNNVRDMRGALWKDLGAQPYFYFAHSYYVPVCDDSTAIVNYLRPISAALARDNFYGVQFHPEKSGAAGETFLRNFLKL